MPAAHIKAMAEMPCLPICPTPNFIVDLSRHFANAQPDRRNLTGWNSFDKTKTPHAVAHTIVACIAQEICRQPDDDGMKPTIAVNALGH